jgi:hypothetical protein
MTQLPFLMRCRSMTGGGLFEHEPRLSKAMQLQGWSYAVVVFSGPRLISSEQETLRSFHGAGGRDSEAARSKTDGWPVVPALAEVSVCRSNRRILLSE